MKLRGIRYNRRILLLVGHRKKIFFILLFFLLFIYYYQSPEKEIYSFNRIAAPSIPDYVPQIARCIIQTSKSSDVMTNSTTSFLRLNPTYKYIHYNDSAAEQFVRKTMPDYIYQTYISLPKAVLKADYFRYIVLLVKGGIYTDIDTICLRPIDTWIDQLAWNKTGLILGIEADASLWDIFQGDYARQIQIVQWTIVAAPGHPILHAIVNEIARISPTMARQPVTESQILEWTGPALWTDIISNYFSVKYAFSMNHLKNLKEPLRVGDDIYVLPISAFSPGVKKMGSKPITHPDAKVHHLFSGSWKKVHRAFRVDHRISKK